MQIAQANLAAITGQTFMPGLSPQTAQKPARPGDPGLEQIFLEHKELVFRAAYRVTGNASDAEDVLQTVFLRLARLEKFPEIANLAGYLHRSAVNASLDL